MAERIVLYLFKQDADKLQHFAESLEELPRLASSLFSGAAASFG